MADKDDELIKRLEAGGDITDSDIDDNFINIKPALETKIPGLSSFRPEFFSRDSNTKKKKEI
ncbi:hypothetical protein QA584_22710 [Anaerocolumna sp. AGMB13025]|uniref:hypothetical protein n=1 Tax=Anaerocolumna sp. AGMB13025 TaxID=3039116 RepID=UPI00241BF7A6|nr:hypothetical protein [Anaerocolumna sp. AGMB13025]WFR56397.1 hypothetical protein QA584_22710 [Anaerocolumna sp. AGMB13025]